MKLPWPTVTLPVKPVEPSRRHQALAPTSLRLTKKRETLPPSQLPLPLVLVLLVGGGAVGVVAAAPAANLSQLTCPADADFSGQTLQGKDWLQTVRLTPASPPPPLCPLL